VALRVSRAILALAIGLVLGLALDNGAVTTSVLAVRIYVVNVDHQAGAGDVRCSRRGQIMGRCNAVEPNRHRARADLSMNRAALIVAFNAAAHEAESRDEEIVTCRNILVD